MTDSSILHRVATSASDRRTFLMGTGAAGAAVLVAACGGSSPSVSGTTPTAAATTAAPAAGDAAAAMLAASLEVLAISTYKAAGEAAAANKLGPVPPAVVTFVSTVQGHHQVALDKWNGVLTAAGAQPVSSPPADLSQTVLAQFAKVTDVPGLAKLALMLEKIAADTYLKVGPTLQSKAAITLAGALQIVDQMHAAILYYVLGQYPVPDVFQTTDLAYSGPGAAASPAPSSGSGAAASPSPS